MAADKEAAALSRRSVLKCMGGAAALGAVLPPPASFAAALDAKAPLIRFAGYDYDRVRGIMDARLGIEGAHTRYHVESIYDTTRQTFGPERTYEVTEIGLIPFIRRYVNEDFRAFTLIPVFLSRIFRHRNVYVHVDSGIEKPEDLRGRKVGTPGYGFSANTWIRGFLLDDYGVKPEDMYWIETSKSSDGGPVSAQLNRHYLADDFPLIKGPPDVDESQLLLSGGCDALITAITPRAFLEGHPEVRRLFPDVRAVEQDYYRRTGVFPIMHVAAVRSDIIEAHPGLPEAAFNLYSQAKKLAYADLESTTALKITLPWVTQEFEDTRSLMGKDFWRYGFEANKKELDLAVRYTYEQGLIKRRAEPEELFHPSTLQLAEG